MPDIMGGDRVDGRNGGWDRGWKSLRVSEEDGERVRINYGSAVKNLSDKDSCIN